MSWKTGLSATFIALGAVLALQAPASADSWQPKRPVEVVVPSAPGGGQDLAARTLQGVMEQLKVSPKPIIVSNKPGGGGTVSIAYINTHEGDGDYSAVQALPLITNRLTGESEIGLDDVTPIAQLLTEQVVFTVAADSPYKTGKDLAEALKKDPAGVVVGVSSSPGGQSHIAAAMVLQALGLDPAKLKIVFFDSGGEAVTALMGGHIQVSATPVPNVLGPVQAGKLRMVAVPAEHRLPGQLADVPTWKEQGVDAVFATWRVLVGPKGMGADELAWWDQALGKVMASNEWKAAAERNLWTVDYKNSKDLKAFLESENTRLAALLKDLGLAKQ